MRPKLLINTRPGPLEHSIQQLIQDFEIQIIDLPLSQIRAYPTPLKIPTHTQALIVTSPTAVSLLHHHKAPQNLPLYCVGDGTANLAKQEGFQNVISAHGTGQDLAKLIIQTLSPSQGPLFYGRGSIIRINLPHILRNNGFTIRQQVLYDLCFVQKFAKEAKDLLRNPDLWGCLFFAPSTAFHFSCLMKKEKLIRTLGNREQMVYFFCLSHAIAAPLQFLCGTIKVSAQPNVQSLLEIIDETRK